MSELLKIILSLSLSGTLLFFIILALKPFYKNKLSRSWQYYIWLIAVARLLLPFTSETTLIGSAFEYLGDTSVGIIQSASLTNEVQSGFTTSNAGPQVPNASTDTIPSRSVHAVILNVYENLWILWVTIAFALLIRKITMYQSFLNFVKAGRTEVSDIKILNLLADAGETIGVRKPAELFVNPLISSPMLLGFFRPYIILPGIEVDRTELACIMRHELTHYRHLDMFYKWLVQIMVCLHWFNPFVYLMAREINKGCELSCDEAVIRTMNKDEKSAYGDTLLNSLKITGNYNDKLAAVTLTEGAQQLKERLDAIMKYKKKSRAVIAATFMLTAVLCIGATAVGAYAAPIADTPWSAMDDGTGQPYTYSQSGYYQGAYIFELGWNLNEKAFNAYTQKVDLILSDHTTITVSFDNSCKSELQNPSVLSDLKNLMDKLTAENTNILPLKRPLVVSIKYIGDSDLLKLAEEYYINDNPTKFSALFPTLDFEVQREYCTKMVNDGKTAFLSASAENMNTDLLDYCAERTYREDKIALFSCIVPYLTDTQKELWAVRASADSKNTFLSVLTDIGTSTNEYPGSLHKFKIDSSGIIEIPVSFISIGSGSEVCLGAIPDICNAKSIRYDVNGESGGSLFVGISPESSKGMKQSWIGSVESATRNIVWNSGNSIGYSKEYSGDYYVYIQSKYGDCFNINGSIVIEYNK